MTEGLTHKYPMNAVCRNCWKEYGEHVWVNCPTDDNTVFLDSGLIELELPYENVYEAVLATEKAAETLAWEFTGAYPETKWQYDIDETTDNKYRLQVYPEGPA